jgi:carbon storage regulator CsrA
MPLPAATIMLFLNNWGRIPALSILIAASPGWVRCGREVMLVLNRTPGQVFTIGDDIRITIVSVNGKNVRVGIEAPREVTVLRAELEKRDAPAKPEE